LRFITYTITLALLICSFGTLADSKESILMRYEKEAESAGLSLPFSIERGKALYFDKTAGNQRTPYCTSCHTQNPLKPGKTRSGKSIEPMAVSANPDRYSNYRKVEKWFRRNCNSVLDRECTALEKGDFLTFMYSQ